MSEKKPKKLISFNIQNEMVVLANMIKTQKIRRRLAKELKPYHWIGKKHRIIFSILKRMVDKNLQFDIDTFEMLSKDEEDFGGIQYIQKIEKLFEENANIDYHVEILKTDSIKHHIKERRMEKFVDAIEDPHSNVEDINKVIVQIKDEIRQNYTSNKIITGIDLRKKYYKDLQERMKGSIFVPTGLTGLDRWLTEGLARKKCSIWSGRPGMGKTTTIANIILNQIRGIKNIRGEIISEPKRVCLVPLETGEISYIDTMVSILIKERLLSEMDEDSAIPKSMIGMKLDRLIKYSDQLEEKEQELIRWALDQLFSNENLTVTDDPFITLDGVATILENGNFDQCWFDLWERLMDIELEANKIAHKLKITQAYAKDFNVHMGIVHQVRRGDSKGKPKKPTMENLKNSGGYEEVSDLIVLLHRAKYYNAELTDDVIEYIIGKQRRGTMNKSAFHIFDGDYGVIGDHMKNYTEGSQEDVF